MSMQTDVIGRVRNTRLSARNGLMPLFEAVVNSIHAVEESGDPRGEIVVRLEREKQLSIDPQSGGSTPIETFVVTDNGVGFTEPNFKSFETMDSQRKASRGGKGVGRLLWLKAFERVEIQSNYSENGSWLTRQFEFRATEKGIEKHRRTGSQSDGDGAKTIVRLKGFREPFRKATVKAADVIAHRLIEHCLEYYLLGAVPRITIEDPSNKQAIDLKQIFEQEVQPATRRRVFHVGKHEFSLDDVLIRGTSDTQHRLHFCAHSRVVESVSLAGRVSHLDTALKDDAGEPVFYHGYVTGQILDESVDAARTGFDLDRDGELTFRDDVSWEDVTSAALKAVKEYLEPRTAEARRQTFNRVQKFAEEEEPRYRPLLTHRKDAVEEISMTLSNERLDQELHRIYQGWRHDLRLEATEKLRQEPQTEAGFVQYKAEFAKLIGDLQDVSKAELADYVVHRATVLGFFEKLLGATDAGVFETEDALHDFLFPQRSTSNDVDFDQHNLWVIDERLVYHRFLSSDQPLSKQKGPLEIKSDARPDILIYNSAIAFSMNEDLPIGSVVIVEFKRPNRTAYDEQKNNPIRQVLNYVELIRAGKARRSDNSYIDALPGNTPFYCYIVADLTTALRDEIRLADYTPTPDQLGYFRFHSQLNAYVEISSYRKVLTDAKKRNKAFFEKLNLRV